MIGWKSTICSFNSLPAATFAHAPPAPVLPPAGALSVADVAAVELARQLTLIQVMLTDVWCLLSIFTTLWLFALTLLMLIFKFQYPLTVHQSILDQTVQIAAEPTPNHPCFNFFSLNFVNYLPLVHHLSTHRYLLLLGQTVQPNRHALAAAREPQAEQRQQHVSLCAALRSHEKVDHFGDTESRWFLVENFQLILIRKFSIEKYWILVENFQLIFIRKFSIDFC